MPHYLTVYGTLKMGHERYEAIADDTMFVSEVWLPGVLHNYKNMFPVLNLQQDGMVQAELHEITGPVEPLIERLDAIEGHPHLFKRVEVEVQAENHDPEFEEDEFQWFETTLYIGNAPSLLEHPIIQNGIWPLNKDLLI
jgi:gamma-glutamylcyclotransferase (GGCT)/AIG2-like uncharacterized protein YtfP